MRGHALGGAVFQGGIQDVVELEGRGGGGGPLPHLGVVPGFNGLVGFPDQLAVLILYPVQVDRKSVV